ncbi:MAG: peptide chain release factor-like protein [Candidatus Omnitrophota bacterium]
MNKAVTPGKTLAATGIRQEDIKESFIRSSAPGGQNVNKTSTCVYLKHLPTGIEVKCQIERSQAQNRCLARKILAEKVARFYSLPAHKALALREKLRRQNRKRSAAQKARILEGKRKRSDKKSGRRKIREIEVA